MNSNGISNEDSNATNSSFFYPKLEFYEKSEDKDLSKNFYGDSVNNISYDFQNINRDLSSKTSNYETLSSSMENNILINSIIYGKNYCKKCKIPCSIIFMDNLDLSFDCDCSLIQNISLKEFMHDYLHNGKNEISSDKYLLKCKHHPNETETKFLFYCLDCKFDLCEKCMTDESPLYSKNGNKNKLHTNHSKIELDTITNKFKNIENLIEKYEKSIERLSDDQNKKEKIENIFKVINSLMEDYQKYKCYNTYKSIENAEKFLEKLNDHQIEITETKKPLIHLLKITSEDTLKNNVINFNNNIRSIVIKDSKSKIDLSIFINKKFPELKELTLVSNKIEDISPLFSCEFPFLERLDLADNQIDNTIIELLEKSNLPELNFLNLFINKITSLKIFEVIKKFSKLTSFFIGENKFKIENPQTFYEFPQSLEEFGITGNFDGNNAEFIKRLGIENLKILYVSRNNLLNLKFLQDIKFKRLEEFWTVGNNITDIKEIMRIQNKKNIKIINLKQNKIKNFNEFFGIIEHFPELQKLTITDNDINIIECIEMKNKVNNTYKHKLDIII